MIDSKPTSAGQDVEQLELSYTTQGHAKKDSPSEEQFGSFFEI